MVAWPRVIIVEKQWGSVRGRPSGRAPDHHTHTHTPPPRGAGGNIVERRWPSADHLCRPKAFFTAWARRSIDGLHSPGGLHDYKVARRVVVRCELVVSRLIVPLPTCPSRRKRSLTSKRFPSFDRVGRVSPPSIGLDGGW